MPNKSNKLKQKWTGSNIEFAKEMEKIANDRAEAKYSDQILKLTQGLKDVEFETQAAAIIKVKDADEALSRLIKVMWLRKTKEALKQESKWTAFCQKHEINIKNADREIAKIGDLKDEALPKFGSAFGYEINRIKYIASPDSRISGVEVKGEALFYEGEEVPLAEAPALIEELKDKLKKERESKDADIKAKDRLLRDKDKHAEHLQKELNKFEKDAEAKGLSLDEDAFLQQMENRRLGFEGHMLSSDPDRLPIKTLLGENPSRVQTMSYIALLRYMKNRTQVAYDTATSLYGGPEDDDYQFPEDRKASK